MPKKILNLTINGKAVEKAVGDRNRVGSGSRRDGNLQGLSGRRGGLHGGW